MKPEKENLAIWVTVEAIEVIELKRIVLDRDVAEAVDFFQAVIVPQVLRRGRTPRDSPGERQGDG